MWSFLIRKPGVALALYHPDERLAGEPRRNEVGPRVLSPLGPEFDGIAFCGAITGVAVGHVVGLDCRPVDIACPGRGGSQALGRHRETPYPARQVSMCPGLSYTLGATRRPGKARGGHPDPYHRSPRPWVTDMEFMGSFPMGLDRLGFGTDVCFSRGQAQEQVILPHDVENRGSSTQGSFCLESEALGSPLHRRLFEDESDPPFPEDRETGSVLWVRVPWVQGDRPRVRRFLHPSGMEPVMIKAVVDRSGLFWDLVPRSQTKPLLNSLFSTHL